MKHNRGFTLIELLVASILVSLTLSTVYVLFYSAMGNWRRVEAEFDVQREVRNVVGLMQREYACALLEAAHLMEGEDDEVTLFLVTEPLAVEEREGRQLLRVRYYYNRSGNEIVRKEGVVKTALPQMKPGEEADATRSRVEVEDEEEFVVASNVQDFSLHYLWVPEDPQRDRNAPPPPVEAQRAESHRLGWGLPQGIELQMTVQAPEEEPYEITATLPTRAPTQRLAPEALASRLRRDQ